MHVERLPVAGALALTLTAFADNRGFFKETYSSARYRDAGIAETFVQDNVSFSHRNVLRGLHAARGMSKLVSVVTGEVYSVIVDVRPGSPTRGRWHAQTLRDDEHRQLYVPAGCLHGFLTLSDGATFLYKQSASYDPEAEYGVRFDDPELGVVWPIERGQAILSAKDAANPTARALGLL